MGAGVLLACAGMRADIWAAGLSLPILAILNGGNRSEVSEGSRKGTRTRR